MKLTDKYILKEIFPMFILGNFFFMFLLLLEKIVNLADLFFAKSVSLNLILETILYFLPSLFVMTIPLACLLSTLIAFSKLSADYELVAMKASGVSNLSLIRPVVIFGLISLILSFIMTMYLAEKGNKLALNNLNKIIENISIKDLRPKEMYTQLSSMIIYVDNKTSNTDFEGVLVVDKSGQTIVSANKGKITPTKGRSLEMIFTDGKVTIANKGKDITSIAFENLTLNLPLDINIAEAIDSPMTMNVLQLWNKKNNKEVAFELSKRVVVPISSIIMSLFGFSLGIYLSRSGKSFGILISIVIAFLYNALLLYLENIAKTSIITPYLLANIPNIIFGIILIFFIRRVFK